MVQWSRKKLPCRVRESFVYSLRFGHMYLSDYVRKKSSRDGQLRTNYLGLGLTKLIGRCSCTEACGCQVFFCLQTTRVTTKKTYVREISKQTNTLIHEHFYIVVLRRLLKSRGKYIYNYNTLMLYHFNNVDLSVEFNEHSLIARFV